MQANLSLSTNLKIVAASYGRLSNGTLGRVRLGGKTDIETVGVIAETFGLAPWQLLVEGLNPKSLPSLADNAVLDQIKQLLSDTSQVTVKKDRGLPSHVSDTEQTQSDNAVRQQALTDLNEFLEVPRGKKSASSQFGAVPKSKDK